MDPIVLVALAGFLVFVAWSVRGMVSARGRQSDRRDVWRRFAGRHGLEVATVSNDGAGQEITWRFLLDQFRTRFSKAGRISGDIILRGSVDGFPVRFDVVMVRSGATSTRRYFTRCTMDVPGLPPELEIRPLGRFGRWLRSLAAGGDELDRHFHVATAGARAQEYLTSVRRATLVRCSRGLDALEVSGGKVYTVTEGQVADPADLERRLSGALDLGRSLTE